MTCKAVQEEYDQIEYKRNIALGPRVFQNGLDAWDSLPQTSAQAVGYSAHATAPEEAHTSVVVGVHSIASLSSVDLATHWIKPESATPTPLRSFSVFHDHPSALGLAIADEEIPLRTLQSDGEWQEVSAIANAGVLRTAGLHRSQCLEVRIQVVYSMSHPDQCADRI